MFHLVSLSLRNLFAVSVQRLNAFLESQVCLDTLRTTKAKMHRTRSLKQHVRICGHLSTIFVSYTADSCGSTALHLRFNASVLS